MSSGESSLKMKIAPDMFFAGALKSPQLKRMLANTKVIISPKDLNIMLHKAKAKGAKPEVDISIIRNDDLKAMLREVKDHRGHEPYRNADINIGYMSHGMLRNYQTFVSQEKMCSLYQLNAFFIEHGFSGGLAAASEAILMRATIGNKEYAAFYVPPIIGYQNKSKILPPLTRLKGRAVNEPVVNLPGFNDNSALNLSPIIDDWRIILESSQSTMPILKDGTHRSYVAMLAGVPVRAIIINETGSLMQSVPLRTDWLVITKGKPKDRSDRFLGMLRIEPDRWEGWVDLASIGIDG